MCTHEILSHTMSLRRNRCRRERTLKLFSHESEEEQECNAADLYICPVKCPGRLSRQTPHISRSNSNTMFESNHVHLRSHFVPILSLSPSSLHRSFAGRNVLAISHNRCLQETSAPNVRDMATGLMSVPHTGKVIEEIAVG